LNAKRSKVVIAIDGPSGVGKSTISRLVAERFGFDYVDTGAMYRAVAVAAADKGRDLNSDKELAEFCKTIEIELKSNGTKIFINDVDLSERIRTTEAGMQASISSALPSVRFFLINLQRKMGEDCNNAGVVMEGRDIGTNVFKDAELKIYLDADEKVRAARRRGDYKGATTNTPSEEDVIKELAGRDKRDKQRKLSPLAVAADAVLIDTTSLTIEEVVLKITGLMEERNISR
jgi:cytidylate kinase